MALQGSGSISMSQINTELGRSSTASISLDTAENGGYGAIQQCQRPYPLAANSAKMSEWFGYNHSATCSVSCGGGYSTYYTPVNCYDYSYRDVSLGGYTSGLVTVGWTLSLESGYGINQLRVYAVYNGSTVADTGNIAVSTFTGITSQSGTITFKVNGADNKYRVYFIDSYCY